MYIHRKISRLGYTRAGVPYLDNEAQSTFVYMSTALPPVCKYSMPTIIWVGGLCTNTLFNDMRTVGQTTIMSDISWFVCAFQQSHDVTASLNVLAKMATLLRPATTYGYITYIT